MLAKPSNSASSAVSSNGTHIVEESTAAQEMSADLAEPPKRWPGATTYRDANTATLRVALLVNLARNAPPVHGTAPPDFLAELDADKNVEAYAAAMRARHHEVLIQEGNARLAEWLERVQPDICFNTCEGFGGESREAQVPALLEMLGVRYSGPSPLAAAITHDKPTTQRVLFCHGLPVPRFQQFSSPDDTLNAKMRFPLFVKPAHEGTGMGIHNDSIVRDERRLREQVAYIIEAYRQPAMVEHYIEGKDITCGLVGNGDDVHFFPITEVDFSGYPAELEPIYGVQQKIDYADNYKNKCPAPLGDKLTNEIRRLTHQVFLVTGCRDFARVDFRLADDGRPYILEINGLPGITPASDLTLMAQAEGWTHADLVCAVLDAALKRYGMKT
jgi:D-alanine-D-alanine ligase